MKCILSPSCLQRAFCIVFLIDTTLNFKFEICEYCIDPSDVGFLFAEHIKSSNLNSCLGLQLNLVFNLNI